MKSPSKKVFTLIELIIVIAIIAILAVTAFLVLTKWMGKSRDSRRVNDISAINSALQIYISDASLIPLPDNYSGVYDTGYALARYQGNFTDNIASQLSNISKNIKDPQSGYYGYSVTFDRKQYQLRALTESTVSYQNNITNEASAASQTAKLQGNYAGFVVTATGSLHSLWNVPSLFLFSGTAITSGTQFTGGNNNFLQDNKTTDNIYPLAIVDVSNLYNSNTSDDSAVYINIVNTFSGTNNVTNSSGATAVVQSAAGGVTNNIVVSTIAVEGSGTWLTKTNITVSRYYLGVGVVNNKMYIVGGTDGNGVKGTVEEYDPSTNTITTKASLLYSRSSIGVGVLNSKIYAIGGHDNVMYSDLQVYDPSANSWSTKASMSVARGNMGVGVVNGKIYAIGGCSDGTHALNTVEMYDPTTNVWTTKTSLPGISCGLGVGVVNNKIYAIGGRNGSINMNNVREYNTIDDTWTTKSTMPVAKRGFALGVVNNKIYVLGGNGGGTGSMVYDPSIDKWNIKTDVPNSRLDISAGVVNNKIYLAGRDLPILEFTP